MGAYTNDASGAVTLWRRFALRGLDALEVASDRARAWVLGVPHAPEPGSAPLRTTDLGVLLRVEALEARVSQVQCDVEALAPIPVAEKRRAALPCVVCGGVLVLILEDAPRSPSGWFNGLCAGCRTFTMAPPDSEVIR